MFFFLIFSGRYGLTKNKKENVQQKKKKKKEKKKNKKEKIKKQKAKRKNDSQYLAKWDSNGNVEKGLNANSIQRTFMKLNS